MYIVFTSRSFQSGAVSWIGLDIEALNSESRIPTVAEGKTDRIGHDTGLG